MTNKRIEQIVQPAKNLQNAFEQAVHDVYQAAVNGRISRQRVPIAQRAGTTPWSPVNAEKQAVSDAAKALAQLWKISPNPSR